MLLSEDVWLATTMASDDLRLELVSGSSDNTVVRFRPGEPMDPLSLGRLGYWRIVGRGVADVQDCPNVLVDTSGSQPEQGIVEWAVAQLGAERLVYGSDVVGRDFGTQLGRVLGARLTARQRDLILGGNACRLLRLEATR